MPGVGARAAEQQEVTLKHTVFVLGVEGRHQDVLGQLRALADHLVPEEGEKGMRTGGAGTSLVTGSPQPTSGGMGSTDSSPALKRNQ